MADDFQFEWQLPDYRPFDVGHVISIAFRGFFARLKDVLPLSILLVGIPGIVLYAMAYLSKLDSPLLAFVIVLGLLAYCVGVILLPAILVQIFVKEFWGEEINVDAAVRKALRYFWPLIGATILMSLGMMAGFLALIVPAFILYAGWYVMIPALVGEGRGPIEALSRSWALTKGSKWQIFGVIVIGFVIAILVGGIAGGIAGAFVGIDAVNMDVSADGTNVFIFATVQALVGVFSAMMSSAFMSATYVELMAVTGEYNPKAPDAIFD